MHWKRPLLIPGSIQSLISSMTKTLTIFIDPVTVHGQPR
jgi:hypothetical protein